MLSDLPRKEPTGDEPSGGIWEGDSRPVCDILAISAMATSRHTYQSLSVCRSVRLFRIRPEYLTSFGVILLAAETSSDRLEVRLNLLMCKSEVVGEDRNGELGLINRSAGKAAALQHSTRLDLVLVVTTGELNVR